MKQLHVRFAGHLAYPVVTYRAERCVFSCYTLNLSVYRSSAGVDEFQYPMFPCSLEEPEGANTINCHIPCRVGETYVFLGGSIVKYYMHAIHQVVGLVYVTDIIWEKQYPIWDVLTVSRTEVINPYNLVSTAQGLFGYV